MPSPASTPGTLSAPSALALDGWLEFNRRKWKVQPRRLAFPQRETEQEEQPKIEAVVYLDKGGQIINPPRNPYLPVRFQPSPTTAQHRREHQWLSLSRQLVTEMKRCGLRNTMNLLPTVADIRAWQWAGFHAGVRYTMLVDLPFSSDGIDKDLLRSFRKAEQAGFRCDRTTNLDAAMICLSETEARQGFSLGLSVADLELARDLLGDDHFRTYICYAPNGEPASASIVLHRPGGSAIGWVGGSRTAYVRASPSQVLEFFIIPDLTQHGASSYDLCGANMQSIAAAKANWGARLQPYYTIESYTPRRLARWTLNWWRFVRPRTARARNVEQRRTGQKT